MDKSSVIRTFCATAAGAGLTGTKMATRIGSLEEFELIEVGGTQQGVSSKMSIIHYMNFCGPVGIFMVWGMSDVLSGRFTGHFVQRLDGEPSSILNINCDLHKYDC